MGSSKNSGAKEAQAARQAEEERQARIRQGTARINGIFDGATTGTGQLASGALYDPNATYYNAYGSVWSPTSGGSIGGLDSGAPAWSNDVSRTLSRGGSSSAGDFGYAPTPQYGAGASGVKNSADAQFQNALKNGLFSGKSTSGGFDDAFFKARRDAYTDYASPQLENQYADANRQLVFALDRSGSLDSSARAEKMSELQKMYDLNKQQVADKALSYETQSRNSVEDARANLIATLNATGDAEGAAKAALARADTLSRPAEYSPLGQLFQDFTSGLGMQAAQERSFAAGGPKPTYNTGLFGNTGRVSVRN